MVKRYRWERTTEARDGAVPTPETLCVIEPSQLQRLYITPTASHTVSDTRRNVRVDAMVTCARDPAAQLNTTKGPAARAWKNEEDELLEGIHPNNHP
ncbi:hypothetical protein J6590_007283 [Homalodisca vitripennis]|nr:hypothetical protein J6590_007283 [Homalodisca vitripennis]